MLIPNQYIGAYSVGFQPEWLAREYMARRGNLKFRPGQIEEARCSLLGYSFPSLKVNGQEIPKGMLQVEEQLEVGEDGYDRGAEILQEFFHKEIKQFYTDDLMPLGKQIIDLALKGAPVEEYVKLMDDDLSR